MAPRNGKLHHPAPPRRGRSATFAVVAALTTMAALGLARRLAGSSGRAAGTHGRAAADLFGENGTYHLHRAGPAVVLENALDSDPAMGICNGQRAVLSGVPDRVCLSLHCLWSDAAAAYVDLWAQPLRELPAADRPGHCPAPEGGQGPVPAGQTPRISFIISMHNNAEITAQCLLELFRTAHEVESAEYILVDDGSTEDLSIVHEVRLRVPMPWYPPTFPVAVADTVIVAYSDGGAHAAAVWHRDCVYTEQPGAGLWASKHQGHQRRSWAFCGPRQQ